MKEEKKARLRYRSRRRGTREMDLLIGGFADRRLESLDAEGLEAFEKLLDYPDPVIYGWITGSGSPPEALGEILEDLKRDSD